MPRILTFTIASNIVRQLYVTCVTAMMKINRCNCSRPSYDTNGSLPYTQTQPETVITTENWWQDISKKVGERINWIINFLYDKI